MYKAPIPVTHPVYIRAQTDTISRLIIVSITGRALGRAIIYNNDIIIICVYIYVCTYMARRASSIASIDELVILCIFVTRPYMYHFILNIWYVRPCD